MKHLALNANEVPRLYRFTVIVDGDLYGESESYLYESEVELMAERVEEVVQDAYTHEVEIDIRVRPL